MNACRSIQTAGICGCKEIDRLMGWINQSAGEAGRKRNRLTLEWARGGPWPIMHPCISHRKMNNAKRDPRFKGLNMDYFCVVYTSLFAMLQQHRDLSICTSRSPRSHPAAAARRPWPAAPAGPPVCFVVRTAMMNQPINKRINQSAHPKSTTHLGQPLQQRAQRLARAEAC